MTLVILSRLQLFSSHTILPAICASAAKYFSAFRLSAFIGVVTNKYYCRNDIVGHKTNNGEEV